MIDLKKLKADVVYTVANKYSFFYKDVVIKDLEISFRHGYVSVCWGYKPESDSRHDTRNDTFKIKEVWKDQEE